MRRREFLGFVGGAAMACPVVARAQQPSVPVVGVLSVASLAGQEADTAAFLKGLGGTGYVEGHNVAIEFRWANNQLDRLPELAADLVSRRVAVISATGGAASARAVKAATTSIPVVFANGQDPVALGLVESINRPSGNLTGVTFMASELGPKRLGLLNELVPGAARYGVLADLNAPQTDSIVAELRTAAASIGRQIEVFGASTNSEIDTAFAELVRKGTDAVVVGSSVLFNIRRVQVVTLAAIHRLPTIYYDRNSVEVGGLMSYGASIADAMRQGGVYVGRVLKGERPGALPVIQAGKFEFVINLQTAKSLRIAVPASMLARADVVIE
jgi:putative tryptophan/tyrosine transport system substrate-binding protein